jgi:hypothetical protein
MTHTPARSAQPSDKPAYVPPRVMRLGDLNEGAGACTAGSGVVAPVDCSDGNNATGVCNGPGATATGGVCNGDGGTATTDICNSGGGAIGSCNSGTGVT